MGDNVKNKRTRSQSARYKIPKPVSNKLNPYNYADTAKKLKHQRNYQIGNEKTTNRCQDPPLPFKQNTMRTSDTYLKWVNNVAIPCNHNTTRYYYEQLAYNIRHDDEQQLHHSEGRKFRPENPSQATLSNGR